MFLIDSILNLAGLLLWLSWRSLHFDPLTRRKPATLIGTLKPAEAAKVRGWMILLSVPALLAVRAVLYWQIGSPAEWLPKMNFGVVVIAFRIDQLRYALLFSLVSFIRFAAIAYFWMAVLSLVTRRVADPDPFLRLLRLQLGRYGRLPIVVQLIVLLLLTLAVWAAFHPLLSRADALTTAHSGGQVILQGLLVFGGLVTTLKLLLPVILLLYMLCSYVYLGSSPLWDFIGNTARGVLSLLPFRRLRTSRLDLAPLAGIIAILLLLEAGPMLALYVAAVQGVTVWPE